MGIESKEKNTFNNNLIFSTILCKVEKDDLKRYRLIGANVDMESPNKNNLKGEDFFTREKVSGYSVCANV